MADDLPDIAALSVATGIFMSPSQAIQEKGRQADYSPISRIYRTFKISLLSREPTAKVMPPESNCLILVLVFALL